MGRWTRGIIKEGQNPLSLSTRDSTITPSTGPVCSAFRFIMSACVRMASTSSSIPFPWGGEGEDEVEVVGEMR